MNKYNIGDHVSIYGYTEIHNEITAKEFRKIEQDWHYQVGHGSWWT